MQKKVGYLPGVFDLLHEGHLNIIHKAKKQVDILVVGVISDEGTFAYKGDFPFFNEKHRMAYIEALADVDLVIPQLETDPSRELRVLLPNILFHGTDWEELKEGQRTLEELGIEYRTIAYTEGISSSLLKEEFKARMM